MTSTQWQFIHDLVAELTGLDKCKVIPASQNAPKPAKPFITLRLYSAGGDAMAEIRNTSQDGIVDVFVPTDSKLEVQYFCSSGGNSVNVIEGLVNSLERPTIVDRCHAAKVAFFGAGEILDTTMLLDDHVYEYRAVVDLDVRYNSSVTDDVGIINEVTMAGAVDGRDMPVDVKGGNE